MSRHLQFNSKVNRRQIFDERVGGPTSPVEAGYPLVTGLTKAVVGALSGSDRIALDEVLAASDLKYDESEAAPNIDEISDPVIEFPTNSQLEKYLVLKEKIREWVLTTNYDFLIEDACAEGEEPAELDVAGVLATWRNQKVPS